MSKPIPAGNRPQQKKSVSKASADKGREDSRAVELKRTKERRSREAQENPAELAKMYRSREHAVERQRKIKRPARKK